MVTCTTPMAWLTIMDTSLVVARPRFVFATTMTLITAPVRNAATYAAMLFMGAIVA